MTQSAPPVPEVVLVEDTLDGEMMSLRAISQSGVPCHVTVQRDGEQALAHLLTEAALPALIVLDHKLPKFNGLEILTQLRSSPRTQLIPIVMFSGTNGSFELADCYRQGANSCVAKPDDANEYVDRLASITRYWLTVNQSVHQLFRSPSLRMAGK